MYDYSKIEEKWQNYWKEHDTFKAITDLDKKKYYMLCEFPYPSGQGLHIGHVRSYTGLDVMARKKRMEGYNVLFPMGWDAFGNPAEQYAIKHHINPRQAVEENVKNYKNQIQSLGLSFDWSREVNTSDPEYYKWTQWQFIQFFKHGMAYKAKKNVNWCPSCKTVLSNEDSTGGVCVRCGTKVVQKEKEQWMLRMSDYAESLLDGLKDTRFSNRVKTGQINWIGKSQGAEINFHIKGTNLDLTVFTTRPDTIYGVTFMVVAPENPIIDKISSMITNMDEINKYKEYAKNKTEFERVELAKEKTGVKLEGIKAINPVTEEEIDIWTSDYVMMTYGTGAIMSVPAHDTRDYDFAKKFNIPIKEVIQGGNIEREAYTGEGVMVNSGILNGLSNKDEAINKMIDYLEDKNLGKAKTNYRLQDWVFSRQRFWGEPIPLIHCDSCGWVCVPDEDLPVVLPDVDSYEPTEDGESPLAKIDSWVNVKCPKCGRMAKRETDTMPNWAGSSWYYLRYMDPHNSNEFASRDALNYWGKVDYYDGGNEHIARHLLYARFWNQFLYNIGLVPNKEPFDIRTSHGMILGPNGEKMSKSKGNVINPDDIVRDYGADALRVYEMFIGDYEKDAAWSMNGLKGCKKFLDRVYKVQDKLNDNHGYTNEVLMNQTIKKVTNDIDSMKFNTAISSLMILLNDFDRHDSITRDDLRTFIHLLNPFAPHITEEINELNHLGDVLAESEWPKYDEDKTVAKNFEMAIQVNGKLRGKETMNIDASKDDMINAAKGNENVQKFIKGKKILNIVVIPRRIVNIVVK